MKLTVKELVKRFSFKSLENKCITVLDEYGNDLSALEINSIFDIEHFLKVDKYLNYEVVEFYVNNYWGLEIYIYQHRGGLNMTRQQLIEALRTDLKFVRRACGDRVANHFTINGITFYLKEISKIEFNDSHISLYVKK